MFPIRCNSMITWLRPIVTIALAAGLIATNLCSCSKRKKSKPPLAVTGENTTKTTTQHPPQTEKTPTPTPLPSGSEDSSNLASENGSSTHHLLDARFSLSAKILFGVEFCSGELRMQFATKASDSADLFKIAEGSNKCFLDNEELDIAKLTAPIKGVSLDKPGSEVKNGIVYMARMGNSVFTPSRPLLPSFIREDVEVLKNLKTERIELSFENLKTGEKGSGFTEFEVLKMNEPFYSPALDHTFTEVITFEIRNTGFSTEQMLGNMLFESMKFTFAIEPIVLLKLELKGPVSKILTEIKSQKENPTLADRFMGSKFVKGLTKYMNVTLHLDLLSMKGIDKELLAGPKKRDTTTGETPQ